MQRLVRETELPVKGDFDNGWEFCVQIMAKYKLEAMVRASAKEKADREADPEWQATKAFAAKLRENADNASIPTTPLDR